MMGFLTSAVGASKRPRGVSVGEGIPEDTEPDDTSILDEDEGSIISSLIAQLRVGMDLSRVTFPTFVLEPRSMLERITDFMAHPDLIFGAEKVNDPEERFIRVLQYYLAGWHIKPKGVKKPYNPVLGEFFRCKYQYPDGTQGFYIAEQVSHHPPISAFFYISPMNKLCIVGELRPKSRFLGNSVSTVMEGENRVYLLGRPDDGPYVISMPNMYARGILFGKMVIELGDTCTARCDKLGMTAEIEFKTKGFFSGVYNAIGGRVRYGQTDIGEIGGRWSHVMEYKSTRTNQKRVLFDVGKEGDKLASKIVVSEDQQESNESRRLWKSLTEAIVNKDMDGATTSKTAVEEAQRENRRKLEEKGEKHASRFFEERNGGWVPQLEIPTQPTQEAVDIVEKWIWGTSTPPS
ncbi:Oxysterol-binding protein [Thelephora ganbajun]|uniref:Oxysterol-binding protein n=1 Tax=Thelephora ganbajun TaxID=370292 RepID=A0ACB6ZR16_THEGA|nr:Oxysterol-binding protein [Thelephora ganbajun]